MSVFSTAITTERREKKPAVTVLDSAETPALRLTGSDDALYERHLAFDNVVRLSETSARERFEALARSVRDVLTQRWLQTEEVYERENPKRIYYISMEFLLGRSLANNIANMLQEPRVARAVKEKGLDWLGLLERGAGRWAREWRTGTTGGLFSGLDGDDVAAGHGLRPAL